MSADKYLRQQIATSEATRGSNLFSDTSAHTAPSGYYWWYIEQRGSADAVGTFVGSCKEGDGIPGKAENVSRTLKPGERLVGYYTSITLSSGSVEAWLKEIL